MSKISKYCREQNMKLTGIIYKITNIINNKVYIGQTVNTIKQRWNKHCHSNGCRSLYNAILKYGKENFNIEIIETLPIEELDEREIYWINYYKFFSLYISKIRHCIIFIFINIVYIYYIKRQRGENQNEKTKWYYISCFSYNNNHTINISWYINSSIIKYRIIHKC